MSTLIDVNLHGANSLPPGVRRFERCNLSQPNCRLDGDGNPDPVMVETDGLPIVFSDCNCSNIRLPAGSELVGDCVTSLTRGDVDLGGTIEWEIDGETVEIPNLGVRTYGHALVGGELSLLDPPRDVPYYSEEF